MWMSFLQSREMRPTVIAALASVGLHAVVFGALAFIRYAADKIDEQLAIETIFTEERPTDEFTKELPVDQEVAESMNVVAGGPVVSGASGGSGAPAVAQQKIEAAESLKTPDLKVNVGTIDVAGLPDLGTDLGEGEVSGDIGRAVEGYGAALGQLTQEILRHMRQERVLAVWLFDESESMKDDQQVIKQEFHKVYEELGIASQQDKQLKGSKEILQTVITAYGKEIHPILDKPTTNVAEVRAAIDKIAIDDTGVENTCQALSAMLDKYGPMARRNKQKLVVILVSDESGNDGETLIDSTVDKAKRLEAPIYILGRESIFGYPYGRLRWRDPKYGLDHWLQMDRGPETPRPEAMQYDGLHGRWDAHSSGFGPYEQARLAKESGGIFFLLPGEEENLVGKEAADKRKFQFYDMKEYVPSLQSRRVYEQERDTSKFRKTIWDSIVLLNPHINQELNIREHWYPMDPAEFQKEGELYFKRAMLALGLLNQAAKALEAVRPLRDKEPSQRWRANYDLCLAQVMAYRVRLFQFCLALDRHQKDKPKPKVDKSNRWDLRRTPKMLEPDAQVVKLTKIDTAELQQQEKQARDLFDFVKKSHPGTPWANRAEYEVRQGFGFQFVESFRDPRYDLIDRGDIKMPKL